MKKFAAVILSIMVLLTAGCTAQPSGEQAESKGAETSGTSSKEQPETSETSSKEQPETSTTNEGFILSAEEAIAIVQAAGEPIKMAWVTPEVNSNTSAALSLALQQIAEEYGITYSTNCYDGVATTGISQIENLVENGTQLILLTPSGTGEEFKDVVAKATKAGCYVMCHDTEIEGAHSNYLVNNYDLGYAMGTAAANWINTKHGGTGKYAVLGAPAYITMVERAKGFTDAITELAPNAVCVSDNMSAISTAEGMEMTENILQANPDVKAMFVIGDGIALGAVEAVKASGVNTDDFGIFSADATEEACKVIREGGVIRTSVSLGSFADMSRVEIGTLLKLYAGQDVDYYVYKEAYPVDSTNVDAYMSEMGYGF